MIESSYTPISQTALKDIFPGLCFHTIDPDKDIDEEYRIKIGNHARAHKRLKEEGPYLAQVGAVVFTDSELLPQDQGGHSFEEFDV